MNLTPEQVLRLAPDAASAAAGRKLAAPGPWKNVGRDERALWGECQGSALYRTGVDLTDLASQCSCPSRKFPCKHALGLMLLAAAAPARFAASSAPDWVRAWVDRRAGAAERTDTRAAAEPTERAPDPVAQAKRAEQRMARVRKGVDALDRWLDDLVRQGLASLDAQPASFWVDPAARLVDAQAPGLAGRLRRMGDLPGSSEDWPARLLEALGRTALLTHAFRRIDALPPALVADVRALVGWTLTHDEVVARGEAVADEWAVVGQTLVDDERGRQLRTWLAGARSRRAALVLDFAAPGAAFAEVCLPGTAFEAEAMYWPSASPQRALVRKRAAARPFAGPLPGVAAVDAFLATVTAAVAQQPWMERWLACLNGVTPVRRGHGPNLVRDAAGRALPLAPVDSWKLFALSGGAALDLAAEWDGAALRPLGAVADGAFHLLVPPVGVDP